MFHLYTGEDGDILTPQTDEGIVNYQGINYSFVRGNKVYNFYRKRKIKPKDYSSWIEATVFLKEYFKKYKTQFPELFNEESWYCVFSTTLFPLLNQWITDEKIPYAGFGNYPGISESDVSLNLRIPIRVRKSFVQIRCHVTIQEADFSHLPYSYFACLIGYFTDE